VDPVHWSTVDRPRGTRSLLIWTVRRDQTAQMPHRRQQRREAAGGGLAGATPGKSSGARKKTGLAPKERGEGGDLTGGLRTAKVGAGEEIHGEVGALAVSSGGGEAPVPARASRGREVVRVEQGVVLPLYRAERDGRRARRRWSGSLPAGH
jgi:hypothetical protein